MEADFGGGLYQITTCYGLLGRSLALKMKMFLHLSKCPSVITPLPEGGKRFSLGGGFVTGSVSLCGLFSTSAQTFLLRLEQNLLDLTSKPFNRQSHHFCGRERTRGSVNYPPPGHSSAERERGMRG